MTTAIGLPQALIFLLATGAITYALLTGAGWILIGMSHKITSEMPTPETHEMVEMRDIVNANIENATPEEFKIACSVVLPIFALLVFSGKLEV